LGISNVVGFGAFTLKKLLKDEFIIEYNGELCISKEASRRSLFFNKIGHTFMFDLNDGERLC